MEKFAEIEYKTFVSGDAASALLAQGVFTQGQLQTNFYYDTKDRYFTSHRGVLRIREKNGQYRFTAKLKQDSHVDEYECDVVANSISTDKIIDFTKQFTSNEEFDYLGKTTTYRYSYQDEYGVWCLDFNVFKYTSDIEIEYELHEGFDDAKSHFLDQLKLWNIEYKPSESKFQRLMKEKDSTD